MRIDIRWMQAALLASVAFWGFENAAAQARAAQRQTGSASQSQKAGLRGDALIQYDENTGSLIIVTDEETNAEIAKVVESLDKPVPQVLIKVLFLEVTHNNDLDLGLDGLITEERRRPFSTQVNSDTVQTLFGVAGETSGGFYRIIRDDVNVTLRALAQVSKLEVLSRPSILTRNNKSAVITVGQEVPFITNSRITQDGQTLNTVQYRDIGIILQVTPHISEDGLVAMDVTPEISALTGQTVPISENVNAPVFAKRSATTSVVVPDGSTVVIGGLMEDNSTKNDKKVPLLGDIPVLGTAFSRKIKSKSKTELLIFLTPRVVQGASDLTNMTTTEKGKGVLSPKAFPEEQLDRFLDKPNGETPALPEGIQPVSNAEQPAADAEATAETKPDAPGTEVSPDKSAKKKKRFFKSKS
ncbi:MAG TPA: hypothetical protein PLO62_08145 [Candidatus Hydrogenedentes bacterium]|nr:hypothetical protein [Candidatus Hydrogenedentota bacterium]